MFPLLLLALGLDAHAAARDLSAEADEVAKVELPSDRATVQAGITGALDPRIRVSGGARKGLTWQASVQHYGRPGEGYVPFPSFGRADGSFSAVRFGALGRVPFDEQVTFELGYAIEPISTIEGAWLGLQTDYSVIGAVVMAPMAAFHTAEITLGLDVTITGPVRLWLGSNISTAAGWFDGRSLMDDEDREPTNQEALELLQPTAALTVRL